MKTRALSILAAVLLLALLPTAALAEEPASATVPTVEEKLIYANGTEIEIVAGTTEGNTNICYDADGDGTIGETEYLKIGGTEPTDKGYDLSEYSVYGGSKTDTVESTDVTMTGGKVKYLYGGGNSGEVTGNTEVTVSNGTVIGNIFGGGNTGAVTGDTKVTLSGGEVKAAVYGGGNNKGATVTSTEVILSGGTVGGSAFGGGWGSAVTESAKFTVSGGTVGGSVYGGGNSNNATVKSTKVTVSQGTVQYSVYGGGNLMTAAVENTEVTVEDGAVASVYGGGSAGEVTGTATVSVTGGTVTKNVCGGGRESAATASGSSALTVGGGAKVGDEGAGVVLNGTGVTDDDGVTNGVEKFAIDPALSGEDGCVFVVLPESAKAGDIIATGAETADVAKLTLTGAGAAGKTAYLDGTDIKLGSYTVTFDSRGGSAVENGAVTGGKVTEPKAPARGGYSFGGWYQEETCKTAWDFATGTVTGDMTLYAKWTRRSIGYIVTATAGEGGSISPGGSVSVTRNSSKTFAVKPDGGYEIADVLVDGESVGAVESYTFEAVTKAHTIAASFREKPEKAEWNPFADVHEGDWFYDSVQYAYEQDLMLGTGKTRFSPGLSTQRGMIATILWRMEGQPEAEGAHDFSDVEEGAYYAKAVGWTDANGIATGYGNGKFGPTDAVTREQLAAVLYRYAQFQGMETTAEGDLSKFTDQPDAWAKDAVQWAVGSGILTGKGGGILDPKGPATRAETAAMLMRFAAIGK